MSCEPIRLIPGPPGQNGADGSNGADGQNAFTVLTEEFTMPAEGDSLTAVVESTDMLVPGSTIYLRGAGTLEVSVIIGDTEVSLKNISVSADGIYPDNVGGGSIIAVGSEVSPTGIQGPEGPAGANGTNGTDGGAAFTTLSLAFTMPVELGTATADVVSTDGLAIDEIVYLETCGYMQVISIGSSTQVTLKNLKDTPSLQYMTNHSPGLPAIVVGSKLVAGGLQGPRGAVGATGGAGPTGPTGSLLYAILQHRIAGAGGDAGGSVAGPWQTVPLNTEVSDSGGIVTLAANQFTLAAGTYRVAWRVPAYKVNAFTTKLQNITDGASVTNAGTGEAASGSNSKAPAAEDGVFYSIGEARFTLAAIKVLAVQVQVTTNRAADGMGPALALGLGDVFASVQIWKE